MMNDPNKAPQKPRDESDREKGKQPKPRPKDEDENQEGAPPVGEQEDVNER